MHPQPTTIRPRHRWLHPLAAMLFLAQGSTAWAAPYTTSISATTNWSALTWAPAGSPVALDTATVTVNGGGNLTINTGATVGGLTASSGWNWNDPANGINGTGPLTFDNGASEATWTQTANGKMTHSVPVTLNSDLLLSMNSTDRVVRISSAISGAKQVRISSTTRMGLLITGASNYSGGTRIEKGGVLVAGSGTLGANSGTNNITLDPTASNNQINLWLNAASNLGSLQSVAANSNAGALVGVGVGFAPTSLGSLNITGASGGVYGINYTGTGGVTDMAALDTAFGATGSNHWYLGSPSNLFALYTGNLDNQWSPQGTYNGATLAPASDNIWRLGGGGVNNLPFLATLNISTSCLSTAEGSVIIGSTLANGQGQVNIKAAQAYTGSTTVNTGSVLNIQNATALGTTDNGTTVNSGATLQIQGGITVGAEALTLSGTGASTTNGGPATTGALLNVSGTNTYGGLLTLAAAATISSDSSTGSLALTHAGTITGDTFGLTLKGAGNGSIASIIGTGTGTLTKSDAGTWTLSGASTYTGVTTVSGGILAVSSLANGGSPSNIGQASAGAAGLSLNSGTLKYTGNTMASAIDRGFTLAAASTIDVNPASTALKLGASSLGAFTLTVTGGSGSSLDLGATTVTGNATFSPSLPLTLASLSGVNQTVTFGGIGTSTVTGATTFSDSATITSNGTLSLATISETASSGKTITLNGTAPGVGSVSGIISQNGTNALAVTKSGTGVWTLSGTNNYTGNTNVTGGILRLAKVDTLKQYNNVSVSNGATLAAITGDGTTGWSVAQIDATLRAISGSGFASGALLGFDTGTNGNFAYDTSISGSPTYGLHKLGTNTLILSGTNTYTGGTTVSAGTLQLSGTGTLGSTSGTLTLNGGTLDLNGTNQGVGNFTGTGGSVLNNSTGTNVTLTIGNNNGNGGNYTGVIANNSSGTGTVALVKTGTGTITLSGANTYTGGTTINGGTLVAGSAAALPGYITTGNVTLASGSLVANFGAGINGWTQSQFDGLRTAIGNNANLGVNITGGNLDYDTGGINRTLASITQGTGGTMRLMQSAPDQLSVTSALSGSNQNGILPWAVIYDPTSSSPGHFDLAVGGAASSPITEYTGYTTDGLTWGTAVNARPAAGTTTLTAVTSMNALVLDDGVTLNSSTNNNLLKIGPTGKGLILQTGGTSVLSLYNDIRTELNNALIDTEGTLIIASNGSAHSDNVKFSSLTKTGPGTLVASSATNGTGGTVSLGYGGPIHLNQGLVRYVSAGYSVFSYYNNATINFNGGDLTMVLTGNTNVDGSQNQNHVTPVSFNANATFTLDRPSTSAGGGYTFAMGAMSGSTYPVTFNPVTVNIAGGQHVTSGTAALTLGVVGGTNHTVTLNGTPTLNITNPPTGTGTTVFTLNGVIGDGGKGYGLIKTGNGTLTLGGTNTYSGSTTLSNGILALAATGSLNASSNISVAPGATLDVSALGAAATYTLGASAALAASGTGTTAGTDAAVIKGGASGTISLGTRPINLTFTPTVFTGDDTAHPSLTVSQGALTLSNNTITVNNAAATKLGVGTYRLIQVGNGTTGTITGTPNPTPVITGTGLVPFATATLSVSAGNVILTVAITQTPFELWIAGPTGFFPDETDPAIVGLTADPDKDGQNNLMEFALGGTPNNGALNGKMYSFTGPGAAEDSITNALILTIAVRKDTPFVKGTQGPSLVATKDGVTYTIEGSIDDLNFNKDVYISNGTLFPLGANTDAGTGYEYRSFILLGSENLPGKGFMRVKVESTTVP